MTAPRRRLVRPAPAPPGRDQQLKLQKLRGRLEAERATLARWMSRLRRAFHAVEHQQQRTARLERQITKLEEGGCPASSR
jgi:hypothetical protein